MNENDLVQEQYLRELVDSAHRQEDLLDQVCNLLAEVEEAASASAFNTLSWWARRRVMREMRRESEGQPEQLTPVKLDLYPPS